MDIAGVNKSTVRLKCVLNVDAAVEWFKDGLPLYTATKVQKKEHWYTVRNMSKADCGIYVCRFESAVTSCCLTLKCRYVLILYGDRWIVSITSLSVLLSTPNIYFYSSGIKFKIKFLGDNDYPHFLLV